MGDLQLFDQCLECSIEVLKVLNHLLGATQILLVRQMVSVEEALQETVQVEILSAQ